MGHTGLDDLALFVALARAGGVRAAARAEGSSRSHLSRRLAALEERLGASLVERDEQRFALTDAGVAFLGRAEAILADLKDAEEAARASSGRVRGLLKVATSPLLAEVALEPVLREYLARHPDASIDLHVAPERVDLRAREIDIAFRTGPLADDAGMRCRALGTSFTAMFAADRYLAARGVPATPEDLAGHDCIVVGAPQEWQLRDARVRIRARLRVNSYALAKRAALGGSGIARFAAVYAARELETGQLRLVLPEQTTSTTVFAVMSGSGRVSAKVRAFLDLAAARITSESLCPESLRGRLPAIAASRR